jgi:hypothetical protein
MPSFSRSSVKWQAVLSVTGACLGRGPISILHFSAVSVKSAEALSRKQGLPVSVQNVANRLNDCKDVLSSSKVRQTIAATMNKRDIFVQPRRFHRQIYFFKFHSAKLQHILRHYRNLTHLQPFNAFLERIPWRETVFYPFFNTGAWAQRGFAKRPQPRKVDKMIDRVQGCVTKEMSWLEEKE